MNDSAPIKAVLVATDGSVNAQRAEAAAGAIASACKCRLIVFVSSRGLPAEELRRLAQTEGDIGAARRALIAEIHDRAGERARQAGVADVQTVSQHGDPAETIISTAVEQGASLIVMGRRGVGTFSELFVGSVSRTVLDRAPCPVTVVP